MRKSYILFLIVGICIQSIWGQCDRQHDSLALVALYNSTDGANWVNSWDLNELINTWNGVILNSDGCLDTLSLSENQLNGSIPSELGDLSHLTYLRLSTNQITGSIPSELGNLTTLTYLRLDENQLEGNIPAELSNLTNLTRLWLQDNLLNGNIPPELSNLSRLRWLWLSSNQLSGTIPSAFGNLSNLAYLRLAGNVLGGNIPPELGKLTKLIELFLQENNLDGNIPPELGNLSNLSSLLLDNNNLSGCIPEELMSLCYLTMDETRIGDESCDGEYQGCQYDFRNNPLLPWQGDFKRFCDGQDQIGAPCSMNSMIRVIDSDCKCVVPCRQRDSLALVALYNSTDGTNWTNTWDLSDPLDTWYGIRLNEEGCVDAVDLDGEPDFTGIYSTGNNLANSIPVEIANMTNLQVLTLTSNKLTGIIPSELGNLFNLEKLWLGGNELRGDIPTELGNLTNLEDLSLASNKLTGSIPFELKNLSNLTRLYLSDNALSKCYPVDLSVFCSMNSVDALSLERGYDLKNNPLLPWQGDFKRFCNTEEQVEAPCDDGNTDTVNDVINEDCECRGEDLCGDSPKIRTVRLV